MHTHTIYTPVVSPLLVSQQAVVTRAWLHWRERRGEGCTSQPLQPQVCVCMYVCVHVRVRACSRACVMVVSAEHTQSLPLLVQD